MNRIIKKLLEIKIIKVFLCIIESLIKRISVKFRKKIENILFNPYDFGEKNISHTKKLYEKIINISKKHGFIIKEKKLLELGPGGFLGVGAFLKKEGLQQYYVIDDINHFEKLDKKQINLYEKIDKDIIKGDKFDSHYIKQLEYTKNGLPLEKNSIDLVFSNAVYEHVKDPENSIKEIARITQKGGLSIHTIDFRDHIFNQKKIYYLNIPNILRNGLFGKSGAWTNRKRYSDFVKYFQANGFDILEEIIDNKINYNKESKLSKKYSKEDLIKISVTFICKKV